MADRTGDHLRLGDAEREQASALLRDHYAEGRLDTDEYSERLDAVWAARTRADLRPVFADLPGKGGVGGSLGTPEQRRPATAYAAPGRPSVRRWVVPVLIVALVVTVVTHLPFVLLALLVCWALFHRRGPRRRDYDWHSRHHYGWR
jgi:hypothetical protein